MPEGDARRAAGALCRVGCCHHADGSGVHRGKFVPQVRFVAWDVAITPDGPVFIEGNSFPSHAIPQFAAHFPDGIGILPRFEAFIDL